MTEKKKGMTAKSRIYIKGEKLFNSTAYGILRFNVALKGLSNYAYLWAESTQCLVLLHISLGSILILSTHLRLGLPKYLFREGVPVIILKI